MTYRFKSKACADLTLLDATARQVLQIIGKPAAPQGVILPEQVPAAVAALEQAAAQESAATAERRRQAENEPDDSQARQRDSRRDAAGEEPVVSLHQRAVPFIQLLRESAAAGERVTWGV